MTSALVVVDVQEDFCEGGRLAVPGGNHVARRISKYIDQLGGLYDYIYFTKDWHNPPPDTNGGHFGYPPDFVDSWPAHCIAMTAGAEFHPDIQVITKELQVKGRFDASRNVFYKGMGEPGYSGYHGKNARDSKLGAQFVVNKIDKAMVCGIAGDYCVMLTALDLKAIGVDTKILFNLTASVGGYPATLAAIQELEQA